jgi:CheY-like chemotaxis protein
MATAPYKTTILVADDDPDDQILLRDAFEERLADCKLCFVSNGVELMERLQQRTARPDAVLPDLLLMDLNMPLKDGRQSLREIRANPGLRRLPTVIMTTSKSEEDRSYCLSHGANAFIVKPTSYTDLLDIVDSLKAYWRGQTSEQPESDYE